MKASAWISTFYVPALHLFSKIFIFKFGKYIFSMLMKLPNWISQFPSENVSFHSSGQPCQTIRPPCYMVIPPPNPCFQTFRQAVHDFSRRSTKAVFAPTARPRIIADIFCTVYPPHTQSWPGKVSIIFFLSRLKILNDLRSKPVWKGFQTF